MALLTCPLRERALNTPESTAILADGGAISAQVLDAWVNQYCIVLEQQVGKDGRLLYLPRNTLTTVVVILACFRSRVLYCPVNPAFPLAQVQAYAQRIGAGFLVADKLVELPDCQRISEPGLFEITDRKPGPATLDLDALCDLIPTSGTTGIPKAVAHTLGNHWCSAEGSRSEIPLGENDSWLLSLPLFHVGGFSIVVRCLQAGAVMIIDSRRTPLAQLLRQMPISHISLVNTQLFRLLSDKDFALDKTSLNYILLGGGAASPALVHQVQRSGVKILTTYGMTEMSSQVSTSEPVFTEYGVTSGKVLPYRNLRVDGHGEILVSGATLGPGYYADGLLTPLVDSEGWYHTGDRGLLVGNALQVLGRMDNMFISGGENIHPEEIEQALLSCQGIVQAVVVVVENEEFGQRPVALIDVNETYVSELFTKRSLEDRISRLKIPDRLFLMPETLPECFSGQGLYTGIKPNRYLLQRLASFYIERPCKHNVSAPQP